MGSARWWAGRRPGWASTQPFRQVRCRSARCRTPSPEPAGVRQAQAVPFRHAMGPDPGCRREPAVHRSRQGPWPAGQRRTGQVPRPGVQGSARRGRQPWHPGKEMPGRDGPPRCRWEQAPAVELALPWGRLLLRRPPVPMRHRRRPASPPGRRPETMPPGTTLSGGPAAGSPGSGAVDPERGRGVAGERSCWIRSRGRGVADRRIDAGNRYRRVHHRRNNTGNRNRRVHQGPGCRRGDCRRRERRVR